MNTREIPMREERVALASGEGFYALTFTAPSSVFDAHRPVFRRVLDSFRPLPPKPSK